MMTHTREHSLLIYLDADGVLGFTDPTTGGPGETAPIDFGGIPDGGTLIGWMHTHTSQPGINGGYPSDGSNAENGMGDWAVRDLLVSLAMQSDRISVDPNMLMYLLDTEGDRLYEYDKDDRDSDSLG